MVWFRGRFAGVGLGGGWADPWLVGDLRGLRGFSGDGEHRKREIDTQGLVCLCW